MGRLPPLAHPLPVAARLLATTFLALLARPIPLRGMPPRPSPRRMATGFATVACRRTKRAKPSLAPLQETNPRTATAWALPHRHIAIMLDKDQGSCCSQRPSPGVELPTPRRDDLQSSPPAGFLHSSIITALTLLHPFSQSPSHAVPFAAIRPRAVWPPDPAKLAPSFAATDNTQPTACNCVPMARSTPRTAANS